MPATSEQTAPLTRGARGVAELRVPSSRTGVHRRLRGGLFGLAGRCRRARTFWLQHRERHPLNGCRRRLTPITLQLQWVAQAQFAGYYAAVHRGFSEDEGLDVTIVEGGPDIVPQDVLAAGDVDYAISWVPKVHGSIEQGANITNVAQIFERSATTQISFKDKGIETAADVAGKNVGSWGFGNEWRLFAGMQQADVAQDDISLIQQAFDMNAFLSGDIDAAQAMTYNEYAQVLETVNEDTGELYQPDELNVIDIIFIVSPPPPTQKASDIRD